MTSQNEGALSCSDTGPELVAITIDPSTTSVTRCSRDNGQLHKSLACVRGHALPPQSSSTLKTSSDANNNSERMRVLQGVRCKDRNLAGVLKQHSWLLLPPFLVFCLLVGLGTFGVIKACSREADNRKGDALLAAREASDGFNLQLSLMSGAALTLGTHVVRDPMLDAVRSAFTLVAEEVFEQSNAALRGALQEVQTLPLGVVDKVHPPGRISTADLFKTPRLRESALKTLKARDVLVAGPLKLQVGGRMALICRNPVFIHNVSLEETFGTGRAFPTGCPSPDCPLSILYDNATRTKFWGFTVSIYFADDVTTGEDTRLKWLTNNGYRFRINRAKHEVDTSLNETSLVVESHPGPSKTSAITVAMDVPGLNWFLSVDREEGWVPGYRAPLIAMVCVVSFVLSALFLLLLLSSERAHLLLQDQKALNVCLGDTNARLHDTKAGLEAEKRHRDALLARQYDLLACFVTATLPGNQSGGDSATDTTANDDGDSRDTVAAALAALVPRPGHPPPTVTKRQPQDSEVATAMGRIAAMRRVMTEAAPQLAPRRSVRVDDDIQTQELLGEGSFGKVYKGLWRGTVVAVKTMVMPASMSGNEKYEKMAVMEAAISSSLAHPNVVQTYTYSIRPVRDSGAHHVMGAMVVSDATFMEGGAGASPQPPAPPTLQQQPQTAMPAPALQPNRNLAEISAAAAAAAAAEDEDNVGATAAVEAAGVGAEGQKGLPPTSSRAGACSSSTSPTIYAEHHPAPPIKPRGNPLLERRASHVHSYEVRLVCEFCDRGSLRDALDGGAFMGVTGLNYAAILDCAMDVAKAMLHLHCNNVLHSDLKAGNVMLSSCGGEGRGARCKVADFGLAVRMDHTATHMSGLFQGTFTHMAPEVLLQGRVSRAADVYSYGITLWELFTGGHPFQGVPPALLGHAVTRENRRPTFPALTPKPYRGLAHACWDANPENRPSFRSALYQLQTLRAQLPPTTPPLSPYSVPRPRPHSHTPPTPAARFAANHHSQAPSTSLSFNPKIVGASAIIIGSSGATHCSYSRPAGEGGAALGSAVSVAVAHSSSSSSSSTTTITAPFNAAACIDAALSLSAPLSAAGHTTSGVGDGCAIDNRELEREPPV